MNTNNIHAADLQPGQRVSIWGRYDEQEDPEVLRVSRNGVWVLVMRETGAGRRFVARERYPRRALEAVAA